MLICLFWLCIAAVCVQAINYLGATIGIDQDSVAGAIKMTAISLPISAIASFSFIMYFSKGTDLLSFPTLNIAYMALGLVIACIIQLFIPTAPRVSLVEFVGILIALAGVAISVFHIEIKQFFA